MRELRCNEAWLRTHFADHSAAAFRGALLALWAERRCAAEAVGGAAAVAAARCRELLLARYMADLYPCHESLWAWRRGALGEGLRLTLAPRWRGGAALRALLRGLAGAPPQPRGERAHDACGCCCGGGDDDDSAPPAAVWDGGGCAGGTEAGGGCPLLGRVLVTELAGGGGAGTGAGPHALRFAAWAAATALRALAAAFPRGAGPHACGAGAPCRGLPRVGGGGDGGMHNRMGGGGGDGGMHNRMGGGGGDGDARFMAAAAVVAAAAPAWCAARVDGTD